MAALSGPRNTVRLGAMTGVLEGHIKTNVRIYKGALVMADSSGYIVPGATATGARAAGRANTGTDNYIDTTGIASGAEKLQVECGTFRWDNSAAGDAITEAEVLKDVYIVDDHTVAKTDGTGTRSIAGKVMLVDSSGVYVSTGPAF